MGHLIEHAHASVLAKQWKNGACCTTLLANANQLPSSPASLLQQKNSSPNIASYMYVRTYVAS